MMLILLLSHLSLPFDSFSSYIEVHYSISEYLLTPGIKSVPSSGSVMMSTLTPFFLTEKNDFEALSGEMKYNSGKAVSNLAMLPSSVGYLTELEKLNRFWHQVQMYVSRFQSQQ